MSVQATMRGVILGAAAAVLAAVALALLAYHTDVPGAVMGAGIWVMDAVVSLVAGFVAGRGSDNGAVLHGLLAAVTLSVVGSLLLEVSRLPMGPLWGRLALSAIMGMSGGIAAVIA